MSYVYFLKRQLGGLVKIGYSINPVSRAASHRLSFGRMQLLGVMPGGRREERRIHTLFCHLQIKGHKSIKRQHMQEFFRPSPELMSFIETNCDWPDFCDDIHQELTKDFSYTGSYARTRSVLDAIDSGYEFSEIAAAYDVHIDSVAFISENKNRVEFLRV